jgi:hypothetical protein
MPGAGGGGLQHRAQLGRTVGHHQRRPRATHPHPDPVSQPTPTRLDLVSRRRQAFLEVQIRPAQSHLEELDISVPAGAQIRLRGDQYPDSVLQATIEHTNESR